MGNKPNKVVGYSLYGVDVLTKRTPNKINSVPSLEVCFSFYPSRFDNNDPIPDILYLYLYLPKSIEDNFKDIRRVFSKYKLVLKPLHYTKMEKTNDPWGTPCYGIFDRENSDGCDTGFYRVSMNLSKLNSRLARYYISLLVFMFIRLYSPGESWNNFSKILSPKDGRSILEKGLFINNDTVNYRHLITNKQNLTMKDLKLINNVTLINNILKPEVSTLFGKKDNGSKYAVNTEYTSTTNFLEYLRMSTKEG